MKLTLSSRNKLSAMSKDYVGQIVKPTKDADTKKAITKLAESLPPADLFFLSDALRHMANKRNMT